MLWLVAAMLLAAIAPGAGRLGRPLNDEERRELGELLKNHDYSGARLVALRFAHKLTRNLSRAQDLMGRVDHRLIRLGWDPAEVSLVKCMCRYVWSEWTHEKSEIKTSRQAEAVYAHSRDNFASLDGSAVSREEAMAPPADRAEMDRQNEERIAKLRAAFEKAGDDVNLFWLKLTLEGEDDLAAMAARSARDVKDFYVAAKRRKRAVERLLAEERGVSFEEDE
jgi:hypothetical protein